LLGRCIGRKTVRRHVDRFLAGLAALPGNAAMLARLHTLGYRGHITTKSRRYWTHVKKLLTAQPGRHTTGTDGNTVGTVRNGVAPDSKVAVILLTETSHTPGQGWFRCRGVSSGP
jgi:hypothetical protein